MATKLAAMTTMLDNVKFRFDATITRVRAALSDLPAGGAVAIADPTATQAPQSLPPTIVPAVWPQAEDAGPLPPPVRKYQRPSAYWADRWITVSKP